MSVPAPGGMHGLLVQQLGARIADGTLTGFLDPEAIAEEFQVSRSLVRECLRTLAAKGMVRARQRLGTQVTSADHWSLFDEQVIRWRAAAPDRFAQMQEALELRQRLEPLAARLNARRRDPEVIEGLRAAVQRISTAVDQGDGQLMVLADTDFHTLLFTGSGNSMLARLAGTVHACLQVPDLQRFPRFSPNSVTRHAALVDTIAVGDEHGAETAADALVELGTRLFASAAQTVIDARRQR